MCKILAPCCGKWFTCRLCHDAVNDHEVDRYSIKTMICMVCKAVQPASPECNNCGIQMARYYCSICHIWENKSDRPIYHCSDCKICRVGQGLEIDYFHCPTCDICMSMSMKGKHHCVEKSLHSNCPICFEYMFTSTKHVVFMVYFLYLHLFIFSIFLIEVRTQYPFALLRSVQTHVVPMSSLQQIASG